MKNIFLATWVFLGMLSMNAFADKEAYNGFSIGYVQSSLNGVSDSTSEFAILRSVRANERYGYEMQFGLFGNIGPYTTSGFLELSAIGFYRWAITASSCMARQVRLMFTREARPEQPINWG